MTRIGYLVPEFPGQTHIFFWREILELRDLGVDTHLLSTKVPPRAIVSHSWAVAAKSRTDYLASIGWAALRDLILGLVHVRLSGLAKSVRFALARGVGPKEKARLLLMVLAGMRLCGVASRSGFTHVHVHSCGDAAHIALFARWLGELRYSLTLHGPLSDYGLNQAEKWSGSEFALVITQRLLAEIKYALAGHLPTRIATVGMGVDLERFSRTAAYTPWNRSGAPRIFSCGRLNPCKGHNDLIAAVGILRQSGLDVELIIAGEDEAGGTTYRRLLEKQIDDLGLRGKVSLLGAVSEDRVLSELASAHVFALASLAEPLGVAIMEALAMRVPVVATLAGGVPELVTHDESALLVKPQDPAALAEAIRNIVTDSERALALSEAGRTRIVAFLSAGSSARAIALALAQDRAETPSPNGDSLSNH